MALVSRVGDYTVEDAPYPPEKTKFVYTVVPRIETPTAAAGQVAFTEVETEEQTAPAKTVTEETETTAPTEAVMEKQTTPMPEPGQIVHIAQVRLKADGPLLDFHCPDHSIRPGDKVLVPAEFDNKPTEGTVVSVGDYAEEVVPYQLDLMKKVLGRAEKPVIAPQAPDRTIPTKDHAFGASIVYLIAISLSIVAIIIGGILFAGWYENRKTATSIPVVSTAPMATPRTTSLATSRPTATPRPSTTPRATAKPTASPRITTTPWATSDPYDAKDYDDPEDFYYDHPDDFFGYEDAEDYWDEYGDD